MENNIHPSPVWMLDPILSDLRWICKEVNPVAGFGYLFPMWFRGILWPQNPVLAWIYILYTVVEITWKLHPSGISHRKSSIRQGTIFVPNKWLGLKPFGERIQAWRIQKNIHYGKTTVRVQYGRPSGGNTIFQKTNPQVFISLYDDETLPYFNFINQLKTALWWPASL